MSDVFLSYAREDSEFVRRLFEDLRKTNREVWVDWQGIKFTDNWWEAICDGILNADNFVFVVSLHSLKSFNCHRELTLARELKKRVIPILLEPIIGTGWLDQPDLQPIRLQAEYNWAAIQAIQWIDYLKIGNLAKTIEILIRTVETDPARVRLHTRLLLRVKDWDARGRQTAVLLRGEELILYEAWLQEGVEENEFPQPTPAQTEFIRVSRQTEDQVNQRFRQRERRIRQFRAVAILLGVIGLVALLTAVGSVYLGMEGERQVDGAQSTVVAASNLLTPLPQTLEPLFATLSAAQQRVADIEPTITAVAAADRDLALSEQRRLAQIASAPISGVSPLVSDYLRLLLALRSASVGYGPEADTILTERYRFAGLQRTIPVPGGEDVRHAYVDDLPVMVIINRSAQTVEVRDLASWEITSSWSMPSLPTGTFWQTKVTSESQRLIISTLNNDQFTTTVLDLLSGELVMTYDGAVDVHYTQDATQVLVRQQDDILRLVDTASGSTLRTWDNFETVRGSALSPDGNLGAVLTLEADGRTSQLHILDIFNGEIRHQSTERRATGNYPDRLAFSPDGRLLVARMTFESVLWDVAQGQIIAREANNLVNNPFTFSRDGRYVRLTSLFDLDGAMIRHLPSQGTILNVEENTLIAVANGDVSVSTIPDREMTGVSEIFTGIRYSGQLLNPGNRVVFTPPNTDENIRIIDLDQRQAFTLPVSVGTVYTSSQGRWLAIKTTDEITVWDAASGDLVLTITVDDVQELGITDFYYRNASYFTFDESRIMISVRDSGSRRTLHYIHNLLTDEREPILELPDNTSFCLDARFICQEEVFLETDSYRLTLLDTTTRDSVQTFDFEHQLDVNVYRIQLTLSTDGRYLLASAPEAAVVWDVSTGGIVRTLGPLTGTQYIFADPNLIYSVRNVGGLQNPSIEIYHDESAELLLSARALEDYALTADADYFLVSQADDVISAYDLRSGSLLRSYESRFEDALLDAERQQILTLEDDYVIYHPLEFRQMLTALCASVEQGRGFTETELRQFNLESGPVCLPFERSIE